MPNQSLFEALCAQTHELMARLKVPGVALGVLADGRIDTAGFGVTNVDHPLVVDADTLFQVGSISKTVCATTALCLAEHGVLDLDAPLRTYLPALRLADPLVAQAVTLRHVLNHTGGWLGDYFADTGSGADALAQIVLQLERLPQLTPLGAIWSYNNAGFYLAGRVIELVGGASYEQLAHDLVFAPLAMNHSFFSAADAITYRVAAGHSAVYDQAGSPAVLRPWGLARAANPLGGVVASLHDMLRYAAFQLGDGSTPAGARLLRTETLAAMQTPATPAANGEFLGLGWFVRAASGVKIVRHGGATTGQQAVLAFAPGQGFAICVLTNSDRGGELHQALVTAALASYLGVVESPPAPVAATASQLAEVAGYYQAALADRQVTVQGNELLIDIHNYGGFPAADTPPQPNPPPMRAALCGNDRLIVLEPPAQGQLGEFLRDAGGQIAWLRIGGRVHRRKG